MAHFHHSSDRQMSAIDTYPSYHDPSSVFSISPYLPAHSSSVDHTYVPDASYLSSNPRSQWQPHISSSYSPLPLDAGSAYSSSPESSHISYPSEYPESSQRTLSSHSFGRVAPSRSYVSSLNTHSPASTPTFQRASWESALYVVDPPEQQQPSAPAALPSVKTEEEAEGSFIFELPIADNARAAFETMPEVPLRATHACKAMRKMMGSFRLDPFAMHNGIRSAAVTAAPIGIEVGPLREEPVLLEFQVHLDYPLVSPSWTPPRSLSPLLYPMDDDDAGEEKWVPQMDAYSPFDAAENTFEPLMTPAQSLNWSMGYQNAAESHTHSSAYPVQPLSVFRSAQSTSLSHGLSNKPDAHSSHHHASNSQHSDYTGRDVYRNAQLVQPSLRIPPVRCQQEYSEYANAVPSSLSWYRKTLETYTACT